MTSSARLLLADDEAVFRDTTATMLRERGYECFVAPDAETALEILENTPVDLVLADIRMPGNDDLRLVRQYRKLAERGAIILITGFPSLETSLEAIDQHVDGYLVKPVPFQELCDRIEEALRETRDSAHRTAMATRLAKLEALVEGFSSQLDQLGVSGERDEKSPDALEATAMSALSTREQDVLREVLRGGRTPAVAKRLGISPSTVRNHLRAIFAKLGVHSQTELLLRFRGAN